MNIFYLQSHPIGKGPDFVKSGFNTCGQSPLVAHFLRMKHLDVDAGMHLRVRRTEVTNLPPYPFHNDVHVNLTYAYMMYTLSNLVHIL